MLRRDSPFGVGTNHRFLGILYIFAQLGGGIVTSLICNFLTDSNLLLVVSPVVDSNGETKVFAALISEIIGTFALITLFMLSIDPHTQFTKDKVVTTFCLSASYIGSRLMAGGSLITGFRYPTTTKIYYLTSGPLLNPALAFGQMLVHWEFSHWLVYLVGPLGASGLALVFYEFVFLRSIEYLNDINDGDES